MKAQTAGVCLTGDVHHSGMGGRDQRFSSRSEASLAAEYLRVAGRFGLRPTLFLTGLSVEQDAKAISAYRDLADCELGGHGYRALTPWSFHFGVVRRLTGSAWLGAGQQRRDIARTVSAFQQGLGRAPSAWRTHAYASDGATLGLLREAGLSILSDARDLGALGPWTDPSGIIVAPINTWPDHEHIQHPASSSGGPGTKSAGDWASGVIAQVDSILRRDGVAILLVHPVCMSLVDEFKTFQRLCESLRDYPSRHISEL